MLSSKVSGVAIWCNSVGFATIMSNIIPLFTFGIVLPKQSEKQSFSVCQKSLIFKHIPKMLGIGHTRPYKNKGELRCLE
jgi:hypothetical protein